jgi:hypothetical protein
MHIGCGAMVAIFLALGVCFVIARRDTVGTSASGAGAAVGGLPEDASDVGWFLPGAFDPVTVYDFKTSESSFEKWVQSRKASVNLEGPKRGPFRLLGYDRGARAIDWRELPNAVAYQWHEEDRGIYMVYDLDEGRAYYWWHSR